MVSSESEKTDFDEMENGYQPENNIGNVCKSYRDESYYSFFSLHLIKKRRAKFIIIRLNKNMLRCQLCAISIEEGYDGDED